MPLHQCGRHKVAVALDSILFLGWSVVTRPFVLFCLISCTSCVSTPGESPSGWRVSRRQLQSLDSVISRYVYLHFSDENAKRLKEALSPDGFPSRSVRRLAEMGREDITVREVPDHFFVEGIPFTQYQRQAEGRFVDGRKVVCVRFFDPVVFPDPRSMTSMRGGYPHYFVLTIDWLDRKVIHHYAHEY